MVCRVQSDSQRGPRTLATPRAFFTTRTFFFLIYGESNGRSITVLTCRPSRHGFPTWLNFMMGLL